MTTWADVSSVLQRLMQETCMSQAELGRRTGTSRSQLNLLLQGHRDNITLKTLDALIRGMGFDLILTVRKQEEGRES